MRLYFNIRFHTHPGESLFISGNTEALGKNDPANAMPLQYRDNETWGGALEADPEEVSFIRYKYILALPDNEKVMEGGNDRVIDLPRKGTTVIKTYDTWNNPAEYENVFYTAPFKEVLLPGSSAAIRGNSRNAAFTHIFKIKAPLLRKNEVVCLAGSGEALKHWSTGKPLLLGRDGNWWTIRLNIPEEVSLLEYKYGIYDTRKKSFIRFENGPNRSFHSIGAPGQVTILQDGFIHLPNTDWRGAGVSIPVFSLRSKKGFGTGEFADLKLLGDWAVETGLRLIQILPVNDTIATYTWRDSYPYAAISAFALHPVYINLEEVAGKKYAELIKSLKKKRKELNELPDLDYEEVVSSKLAVLKVLFAAQKEEFLEDPAFLDFFEDNKDWLVPYAAFSCLRDKYGTADYSQWKTHREYVPAAIERYTSSRTRHYNEIATYYFIQYHLYRQLKEASDYLHRKGVVLKGDIPIGIYRYSCDAWMAPGLYNMHMQAGAPPDAFAVKGQNWGFPTYNWTEMAKDGYQWWRRRFEQMQVYFDSFRIDHILGFFRIWSVPVHAVEGIMGYFDPALPVHLNEFSERGIWFDHNRYTKPYINDEVLNMVFGEKAPMVKDMFLNDAGFNQYDLKETFNTQQKIAEWFTAKDPSDGEDTSSHTLRSGLFDLASNIILLEVEGSGGEQFHFRISMEDTSSFKALEWDTRQRLKELYINYFYRRQDDFWRQEGMRKLPALKNATNMLVCGEDLGMVPACVPDVMRKLNILSLEVQRMPKDPGQEFFNPRSAPYLSVVTPSTHDMSTIRGWWEEDKDRTQHFFNSELGQQGPAPFRCEPWICKAIILQHLHSPALLSIFQLQDLMSLHEELRAPNPARERINIPANPQHYWNYRIPYTLEHLLKEKTFNHELRNLIKTSGRADFK